MFKELLGKLFPAKQDACCGEKTLSDVPIGGRVAIQCLRGEEGVCRRLREMGFNESSVVEKVADSGALICKICDTKIIISKKLAENIVVEDVGGNGRNGHQKTVLLSKMSVGQRGVLRGFIVESDDCERLEEMGLTPGEQIEVIRYAPMGDPIEIKIRGYLLSLRKEEAEGIEVTLTS